MSSSLPTPPLLGGILLVVGNVIGAGILALPIATAQLGLPLALLTLILFWGLLLIGAYYFLEANLALPEGANLVSMARTSLGKWGALVAWICTLLVMHSLLAAYIAGGGDLIQINLQRIGLMTSSSFDRVLFLVTLGTVAILGIARVDYVNRVLMFLKAGVFLVLVFSLMPHFEGIHVVFVPMHKISSSLVIIVLTSYGFAPIIPSLRRYYRSDVKKIKTMMLWGMVIALICYLAWVIIIFGVIPYQGQYGLENMASSAHPVSDLQLALNRTVSMSWIIQAINMFSGICIMTSFLANSICLADFIGDGLHAYKRRGKSALVYLITYGPPLAAVLFYPRAFLLGLSIAGTLAIILLLILPTLMVYRFRYIQGRQGKNGQLLLLGVLFAGITLLVYSLMGYT